ncbi:MAG: DNA polymerase III subunit delta [Terriglobia bacterium]
MRPSEFCAIFEKNKPGPVYFLRGPDGFLHEECRAAAVASLPQETREWCLTESVFKPGELQRELENTYQMPMLGERSLLYVTDMDDFERAGDTDAEALAAFLKKPPSFTTVAFAAREPDRRRRFIQLLDKGAEVVEMTPLPRREAAAWLKDYLRKAGVEIQAELAESAVARFDGGADASGRGKGTAGVNLLWLRTEMEKLLVARPGLQRLEKPDLDLIVAPREEHEIGKLLAAVAERKLNASLIFLRDLIASKEPETLVLWCLGDLFRQALKSSGSLGRSGPWSRAANPYATFEIAPRAHQAYSREEMGRALRLVRAADLAVKSSWKDSRLLLESLLWQIMAGKDAGSMAAWPAARMPAMDG